MSISVIKLKSMALYGVTNGVSNFKTGTHTMAWGRSRFSSGMRPPVQIGSKFSIPKQMEFFGTNNHASLRAARDTSWCTRLLKERTAEDPAMQMSLVIISQQHAMVEHMLIPMTFFCSDETPTMSQPAVAFN
jgi:hypothetical protein